MVSKSAQAVMDQRRAAAAKAASDQKNASKGLFVQCSRTATKKIDDTKANSTLFNDDMLSAIPTFKYNELDLGKVLGKGGFGTVSEIRGFKCSDSAATKNGDDDQMEQLVQDKKFIADHCIRDGGDSRYAIKVSDRLYIAPSTVSRREGVSCMSCHTAIENIVIWLHL